jgi:hypothetical protein
MSQQFRRKMLRTPVSQHIGKYEEIYVCTSAAKYVCFQDVFNLVNDSEYKDLPLHVRDRWFDRHQHRAA